MPEILNPYLGCDCTPSGEEHLRNTGWLLLTMRFNPGCPRCATCTCQACEIDPSLEYKWNYFVAYNISCNFCYSNHPDRHLYEELHAPVGIDSDVEPENQLVHDDGDPPDTHIAENVTGNEASTGRRRRGLRKLGASFLQKMGDLWKKEGPSSEDDDIPGQHLLRRALTFATARRGRRTRQS